jgi:UV DNA damage endonuclease
VSAAHADYIYDAVPTFGRDVDIMFEAKAKERAVEKYRREFIATVNA